MKEKKWFKSVISSYTFIDRVTKTIDKQVLEKGLNSHQSYGAAETLNVAEKIFDLSFRKKKLLCLKNLIEQSLKNIPAESAKILSLKVIDKLTDGEISDLLCKSQRTITRKIEKAFGECYVFFVKNDYDIDNLKELLKEEKWLSFNKQKLDNKNFLHCPCMTQKHLYTSGFLYL